jgi:hypothetical protein
MRSTFHSRAVGSTATLVLLITACEKTTLPPPSNNTGIPVTETFAGTLQPSGEAFYSFGMSVAGTISLTLVSVTGSSVPDDALFPLGIGLPVGTGCRASVDAAAGMAVEVLAHAEVQHGNLDLTVAFRDADLQREVADGGRRESASTEAADGRHALFVRFIQMVEPR